LQIPILNIPAADLALRPEFTALLPYAGLQPSQLITLDDVPPTLTPGAVSVLLVDHNAITGPMERFADGVSGCIDHHDDEGKVPATAELRIIERTGSCTSLVVGHVAAAWDALDPAPEVDAQVAKLALGAILIDTGCLGDGDKVTEHDRRAVDVLEGKIAAAWEEWDREVFYAALRQAKEDLGPLALRDVLRKDYKEWDESLRVGVASVVKPLAWMADKAGRETGKSPAAALLADVDAFAKERNAGLFAVMTTHTNDDGHFHRELLLLGFGSAGIEAGERFVAESTEELSLAPWAGSLNLAGADADGQTRRWAWEQHATQHSRKRVGPLLRAAV
ncbi:DHH phosphoesterase, partial [Trichodelitschia bisporula]